MALNDFCENHSNETQPRHMAMIEFSQKQRNMTDVALMELSLK